MASKPKLESCPFCGGEAVICGSEAIMCALSVNEGILGYQVCCTNKKCGGTTRMFPTPETAAAAWNRREVAMPPNASAMLTALRKLRYLASVEIANKADGIETTDLPQAILYNSQKALSEPLRNCDKFGFLDLARLAFQEVEEMPEGNDDTQMRGWLNRFVEWLFAPATEQIGETGESK